jgi:ABC-type branched-subunit amino acid transport system substrate-binding protein
VTPPSPLPFSPAEAESLTAAELIAAALEAFHPQIALACSFQQEEAVLLELVLTARPDARVFALDTGVLFPETYATWRAVEERYGIEIATGGNILPAMVSYKQFPGMEGAAYYYFGMPKNEVNEAMVARHYSQFKSPPDFFTAGGFSSAMALVTALKKTNGDTNTNKLISTMEGMSFDTPKGKMTFRKEDHQAMQSMYHFKIKIDPAFAWGVPELIREIKPEEMNVPIRNKR